jgi:hypothetical protein
VKRANGRQELCFHDRPSAPPCPPHNDNPALTSTQQHTTLQRPRGMKRPNRDRCCQSHQDRLNSGTGLCKVAPCLQPRRTLKPSVQTRQRSYLSQNNPWLYKQSSFWLRSSDRVRCGEPLSLIHGGIEFGLIRAHLAYFGAHRRLMRMEGIPGCPKHVFLLSCP